MRIFLPIAYSAILLLAVTISGYLSYEGLLKTGREITLLLVCLLMGIIFMTDAAISYFRLLNKRIWFLAMIWCTAAFFSIASNFNFLYSNFMRDNVTQSTVTAQLSIFRDDLVATRARLDALDSTQFAMHTRTRLKVELDNLRNQINDPLRPGCGEECRGHMNEVERIIGGEVTNFQIPAIGSNMDVVNAWFTRYSTAATEILSESLNATQYPAIANLKQRIDDALLRYDSVARIMANEGGLSALPNMAATSLEIERQANTLLPEGDVSDHRDIDPTLGRLGEIVYAFQNGFGEMPNPMATTVSLILASAVDILPFLLSFALFGKGRLEKPVPTNRPGGRSSRHTTIT